MPEPDLSGLDAALGSVDASAPAGAASVPPAAGNAPADTGPDLSGLDKALDATDQEPKASQATPKARVQKPVPRMAAKAKIAPAVTPPAAKDMSWSDVGKQAASNFVPSFTGQIKGAVEPFLPKNWGTDVRTAVQLAKGVASKTGFIDTNDTAAKAKDEALVNSIGEYYKSKYGTMEGFKQALAADPASILTDASAVLSIPAGGEGLLAKLPGALGEAGAAGARLAGVASRATNPIGIAGRAASAVLPKASAVNALGKLNGGIKRTVSKAFNGRLDPGELESDPATLAAMQQTVRQKGATPAAVKEALLRRFSPQGDAPIPSQSVTGQAAPYGASGMVRDAIGDMKGNVARAATEMTGATAPHDTALGDALEQAQIGAHNNYVENYNKVAAHPGQFDPSFAASLPTEIESNLKSAGLPSTAADMMKHPEYARGEAVGAMNWLTGHVADLAANNSLTPQELMNTRKSLGYLWTQSKGSDSKAVASMIDALDSHIEGAAQNGLYTGGNGAQVASDMKDAIGSYRGYKQAYANTSNPTHGGVATAMKNIMPDQVRDPSSGLITSPAAPGSAAAAQGQLVSKLINPRTLVVSPQAEKLYDKILSVSGGPGSDGESALRDFVRQSVTKTTTDAQGHTSLAASPDQIHAFLGTPLAAKAFSPQEMSTLRQAAEAQRLLLHNPSKSAKVESLIGALAGRSIRTAGAATLGHVAGGPLGGFLAGSLEYAAESGKTARQAAKELKGAPASGSLVYGPGRAAAALARNPSPVVPAATLFNGSQPQNENAAGEPLPDGPVQDMVKAAADRHGVDPDLAMRVAKQESAFSQNATSKKGAHGVMQLMPATAKELGVDPNDQGQNIEGGVRYLGQLIEHYRDPALAVAAYNAGPGAVNEALSKEQHGNGGWLGHLPAETQDYVKKIIMASNDDSRVGRSTGGKIESHHQKIERLVSSLMALAKSAKKVENKRTEPLLRVADDVVAKALHVAKRSI